MNILFLECSLIVSSVKLSLTLWNTDFIVTLSATINISINWMLKDGPVQIFLKYLIVFSQPFLAFKHLFIGLCSVIVVFLTYALVIARFWVQYGQYFPSCSYFADLFHEPLGEWNKNKIWETRKILAILCEITCDNYLIVIMTIFNIYQGKKTQQ